MGFDRKWYGDSNHAAGADNTGASELSWGPGPVPPGAEFAAPRDGGKYNPRSPDMTEPPRRYRKGDPPLGHPGYSMG